MTGYPCCEHCLPAGTDQGGHGTPCLNAGCVGNAPGVLSEDGNWLPMKEVSDV